MSRWLLLTLSLLLPIVGHAEVSRTVGLNYMDATVLAAYLGGVAPGGAYSPDNADAFARQTIAQSLARLPQGADRWQYNAAARSYPGSSGGAVLPVPEGLSSPPVALPGQNTLLLRGTGDAVDQTIELIKLLDRPVPMINVELKLVDEPQEVVDEWGVDFQGMGGGVAGGSVGNAPAAGAGLRWGLANVEMLGGLDQRRSRGRNVTGANVTTFNNVPATVSFGETIPFFVSRVSYDLWGNRQVASELYSIFAGIELFVHPRITGDDTITMRLVPTITEAAGLVTAPDGSNLPITKTVQTDTQVRVRDGESLVIAGFDRLNDSQTDRFKKLLGEKTITRSSHPVLIVTPHIIRQE